MTPGIFILLAVIIILAVWLWATYNGLIRAKLRTDEAWSDINVQLKRRYDLIPNLIETVKGYAAHEKDIFETVSKARAASISATAPVDKAAAEDMLSGALNKLFAVAEAYPDLKANQNFSQLQTELVDTEDKIQAARRFYNGNVRDFNIKLQVFPTNIIGNSLGFKPRDFFDVANQAQIEEPVKVSF